MRRARAQGESVSIFIFLYKNRFLLGIVVNSNVHSASYVNKVAFSCTNIIFTENAKLSLIHYTTCARELNDHSITYAIVLGRFSFFYDYV